MTSLDLDRLHSVTLDLASGVVRRRAGNTVACLVGVFHAIWAGEQQLISVPLYGSYATKTYGSLLLDELGRMAHLLGADYRRTDHLSAMVDGVPVRVHMVTTVGMQNCTVVLEEFSRKGLVGIGGMLEDYYDFPYQSDLICPATLAIPA